jgi:hypothetical protein
MAPPRSNRRSVRIAGVVVALVWIVVEDAAAQNQTIRLNTGLVGQAGTTAIPLFGSDDDWNLIADPVFKSPPPRPAMVVEKWALMLPISRWISGAANKYMGSLPAPPTRFTYQACFTLPAEFLSSSLKLEMRGDDIIRQVRLNASTILFNDTSTGLDARAGPKKAGSFLGSPLSITYNSTGFQPGKNCVDIVVEDEQEIVSGLNVVGTVTYQGAPSGVCLQSGQVLEWDLSTGTNLAGVKNLRGTVDPKWKLVTVPTGFGGAAYSVGVVGTWVATGLQPANWIQRKKDTVPASDAAGVYTYRAKLPNLNFSLYSSIKIVMRYAADNSAIVRLNGVQVDSCAGPNCYSAWRELTLTPTAPKYLDVQVTNTEIYTGLIVDGKLRLVCK